MSHKNTNDRNLYHMLLKITRVLVLFFLLLTVTYGAAPLVTPVQQIFAPQAYATHLASTSSANPDYVPISAGVPGFVPDSEVTAVGKNAVRTQDFLDWVLVHGQTPNNRFNAIAEVWIMVRDATFAFASLIVIGVGFLLMIRRNKDIKLLRFLPLFIVLMIYVFLSFTVTKTIYQLSEGTMRGFLKINRDPVSNTVTYITSDNLLHVQFPYETFDGERRSGMNYDESADTSLLLIKMTSWTYMTMAGILIVRQIILWFFIILSPFLALLLPFPLIRNTAKIWIGEFFKWLAYGLLFATLLRGLVTMWQVGIPMNFTPDTAGNWYVKFPTSINIMQAGPNYNTDSMKPDLTSINTIDTYVNYVVALIMLWVVILLPWILLRIFRDMMSNLFKGEGGQTVMGQLGNMYSRLPPPFGPSPSPAPAGLGRQPSPQSPPPASTGKALELPFKNVTFAGGDIKVNQSVATNTFTNKSNGMSGDRRVSNTQAQKLMQMTGMQTPTMADIARMEMNNNRVSENMRTLQKIGNPNLATNAMETQKFSSVRAELTKRSQAGDQQAQSLLQAANAAAASVNADRSDRAASSNKFTSESREHDRQNAVSVINTATTNNMVQTTINNYTKTAASTLAQAIAQNPTQQTISQAAKASAENLATMLGVSPNSPLVPAAANKGAEAARFALGNKTDKNSIAKAGEIGVEAIASVMQSAPDQTASKIVQKAVGQNGRIMPVVNRVQSVSLDDYEEVKKMWLDHYRDGAPPVNTQAQDKRVWIKQDIEKSETAIQMIGNITPEVKQKGLEMVAALLPFLLLGGFSEQETIAYLKAKTEAAKQVLAEVEAKESGVRAAKAQEEDETLELKVTQRATAAEGHLAAELPEDEKPIKDELDMVVDAAAVEQTSVGMENGLTGLPSPDDKSS